MPKKPTGPTTKKKRRPPDWKARFLEALRATGLVSTSCAGASVHKDTAYEHRKKDPAFAAAWDEALELATDALVVEARRRAHKGTLEPVYYQGKRCGEVRRYSDTLIMFLIKKERPEYRESARPAPETGRDDKPEFTIPDRDARFERDGDDPDGRPPEAGDPVR